MIKNILLLSSKMKIFPESFSQEKKLMTVPTILVPTVLLSMLKKFLHLSRSFFLYELVNSIFLKITYQRKNLKFVLNITSEIVKVLVKDTKNQRNMTKG